MLRFILEVGVVKRLLLQSQSETHPNVTDGSQAAKRLCERCLMTMMGYVCVSSARKEGTVCKVTDIEGSIII